MSHEIGLLTSGLELHPRSTELATALASLARRADLPLRQLAEILLLQVRSALARGDEDGASRQLARLVEAALPERFASFYCENQAVLAEAVTNRLLRHVLKRMPQLARRLSAVLVDATPEVADDGAGLTRQERRILALLVGVVAQQGDRPPPGAGDANGQVPSDPPLRQARLPQPARSRLGSPVAWPDFHLTHTSNQRTHTKDVLSRHSRRPIIGRRKTRSRP